MLKVGIAGLGKMGQIRAREAEKRSGVELVAVYEANDTLTPDLPPSTKRVDSFEALLDSGIDAVFVCAYNNVAADYCIKAIKKGLHVFCEKPPATTSTELKEVIKAEKQSSVVLKYGFNHRLHYSVLEAKKLIDSKEMGKLLWLRGVYGKAGSIDYHKNWRNFKKYSGGGILMDQGIHMLDLIHYLTQRRYETVSSVLSAAYWDVGVEDNALSLIHI